MGLFDELKRLTSPYDDEDGFFNSDEDTADRPVGETPSDDAQQPPRRRSFFSERQEEPEPEAPTPIPPRAQSRAPRAGTRRDYGRADNSKVMKVGASQQKVVLVSPKQFDDAVGIANHLRDGHTVLMNLESTDKLAARRLVDFLSGVAFAQDGKIKKVSGSIFLITPCDVALLGGLVDEIENSSFSF